MRISSLQRIPPDHDEAGSASDPPHVQISPQPEAVSRPGAHGVGRPPAGIPPTILAASDDRAFLASLVEQLQRQAYRVIEAVDGPSALEKVRHERPAVVVLDVNLGAIGGLEVCRRLRHLSDVCVLMLADWHTEDDRVLALSIGADAVLDKPFNPKELAAWITVLLRRARRSGTP
jgi:DNA-binding response OmpR family regulator